MIQKPDTKEEFLLKGPKVALSYSRN